MAALSFTVADVANALRSRYSPDKLRLIAYERHPLLGMIPKFEGWDGDDTLLHNVWHKGARGKGTTIQQAQANQAIAAVARFQVDRQPLYSVHQIEREFLLASRSQQYAMLQGKTAQMDSQLYEMTRDISRDLYRAGTGALGRAALTTYSAPNTTIVLLNPEDVVNFEVGMFVGAAATDGGAVLNAGEYLQVIAVNRGGDANIVVSGDATDGTDWETGNAFIYERGDAPDGGAIKKLMGLQGWCPASKPVLGVDSFLGVDRGVDPTRLAGHRFDATTDRLGPLEAVIEAGTQLAREGASPDICLVNPKQRAQMVKSLQAQHWYDVSATDPRVFYKGVMIETGAGEVPVVADPDCPVNRGFLMRRDAIKLRSLLAAPHLVDEDGLGMLRAATEDSFEVRFAAYVNMTAETPSEICQITFQ